MKGIALPPRSEDFTADPVELFFDLGYVLAFTQLVGRLVHHPDWVGVGQAGLLFVLLWLPWSQFTWSANAVSGNGRLVRLLFLVATAVSIPMATSVSTALGPGGPVFAICLGTICLIALATMALGVERESESEVYRSLIGWGTLNLIVIAVLIGGAMLEPSARLVAWIVAFGILVIALINAGRGEWIVRPAHFAERHGLIVIIALGEVIVAIGAPVVAALESGKGLSGLTVVALVASGAFAGLVWWSYFDRFGRALEHRAEALHTDRERGRYARDVYTLAHAPIVAGIILAAAALEEIALHPADPVPAAFRAMLAAGLALMVLGVSSAVWRAYRLFAQERFVASIIIAAVLLFGGAWIGAALLVAVVLIMAASLALEHVRVDGRVRIVR